MEKTITHMVILGSVSMLLVLYSTILMENPTPVEAATNTIVYDGVAARDLYVELPPHHDLERIDCADSKYIPVVVTYEEMELTYVGMYFITAYCPAECDGSWSTASGAICHRADWDYRYTEPTTCAIDRNLHSFGEEFYIEEFDRVLVAEDTGSGVQGHWIDIFYEDYSDVLSFPTGWYPVYSVEWVEKSVVVTEEQLAQIQKMGAAEYFAEYGE